MRVRRRRALPSCIRIAALAAGAVSCTPALSADGWQIVPSVTVRETLTDNVSLEPAGRSDLVTEIVPTIQINHNRGRLQLRLSYQADAVIHARDSSRSELQNSLDATATLEAVEKFFFVDLRANISQEVVSPFGPRPPSSANFTDNRTESRVFSLSPYIRGQVRGLADYTVRYTVSDFRASNGGDNSRLQQVQATLNGIKSAGPFGWSAEALVQRGTFENVPDATQAHLVLRGTYAIDPQLVAIVEAGAERNNVLNGTYETHTIYGGGVQWAPSQRTQASAKWERRFFGDGWEYTLQHRMRRLALRFTDRRDVSTDVQRLAGRDNGVAFNLLFNALASRIPDPAERTIETQRLLREGGIPPDLNLPPDFLTNGVFLERRQELSAALQGVRNTVVLTAYRSRREQLQGGSLGLPEQARPDVNDYGTSVAWSYRLSPLTSVTGLVDWYRTTDVRDRPLSSQQWTGRVIMSRQLTPRTSGSVEVRHVRFNSTTADSYRENAVAASVSVRF